jgi:hypothetical protein
MTDIVDELSLMVALFPDDTGLPMVIWASPSYGVSGFVMLAISTMVTSADASEIVQSNG